MDWEEKLKEHKMALFGPPQTLVMEKRRGKEDVHLTALRLRKEMGLVTKWSLTTSREKQSE